MAVIISLFNHKGGVSKTTTTFNLGWALAESGRKVLLVDGDPQCNLTGTVLGFEGQADFETFYKKVPWQPMRRTWPRLQQHPRASSCRGNPGHI